MTSWFFVILMLVGIMTGTSGMIIHTSYAQMENNDHIETSEQTTLSDDLLNDPMAQDLLKKIEQTRKWIADLEQKEFEKNQAQQNLEKMRAMSLERLNQDLREWERLWEKHSSRNAFESFVSKKPEYVQGVFWDQFEFKEQRIKEGREALKQVLLNGGSLQEAREAYHNAAKIQKIELIEMNAQFNVKHNLAYYGQQQLFNSTGQFHPSQVSATKLVEYYTDYRQDPTYLMANPDDEHSAKYGSNANANIECKEGYLVIHRIKENDYTCINASTAEMWERNGMGKIIDKDKLQLFFDENSLVPHMITNPGTQCKEGYSVLYHIPTSEYRCVSESVAKEWMDEGVGEIHDLARFILGKDHQKTVLDKIYEINQEIIKINKDYGLKQVALELKYDDMLKNEDIYAKQSEKDILQAYNSNKGMTKEELSKEIVAIRENHEHKNEQILAEQSREITNLESELKDKMLDIAKMYENNLEIDVIWNSVKSTYEAVLRR